MSRVLRSRLVQAVLVLVLWSAGLIAGAGTAAASSSCPMGDADSALVTPGQVPVLFVHGINSGPGMWDTDVQGLGKSWRTLAEEIPGVSTYAFSYHDAGLSWVTDSRIGPALAETIACLGDNSHRKVIVVAHSMGGLSTQFALSQVSGGSSAADRVATVVTLGTPFKGSRLLSVAQAARLGADTVLAVGGNAVLAAGLEAALAACAKWGQSSLDAGSENPCGLAAVPDSPVGRALQYGSAEIAALPKWPRAIRVIALAGDLEVADLLADPRAHALVPVGLGDVAVSIDSAIAVGNPEEPLRCLMPQLSALFASPCWHVGLPTSQVLAGTVLTAIRVGSSQQSDVSKTATASVHDMALTYARTKISPDTLKDVTCEGPGSLPSGASALCEPVAYQDVDPAYILVRVVDAAQRRGEFYFTTGYGCQDLPQWAHKLLVDTAHCYD